MNSVLIRGPEIGAFGSFRIYSNGTCQKLDDPSDIKSPIKSKGDVRLVSSELEEVCAIYGLDKPIFPSKKWRKPFKDMGYKTETGYCRIPWCKTMPTWAWKEEVRNYFKAISEIINRDLSYYGNCYKQQVDVFNSLEAAAIDVNKFSKHLSTGQEDASKVVLKTFTPEGLIKNQSFRVAQAPIYDHATSVTGRLKIKKGPNILHLRKEYRDIIRSTWEHGRAYYLDYKALEPRVLLAVKDPEEHIPKDPYMSLLRKHELEDKISRDAVKIAINSITNGAGEARIVDMLDDKVDYPEDFINLVKDYFGVPDLRQKLLEEYRKNNERLIYNFYGRPIQCAGAPPYVLLNYYVQSTAVDIALFGFQRAADWFMDLKNWNKARALYVLHDALIVDVNETCEEAHGAVDDAIELAQKNIPGFESVIFWIDKTPLHNEV